MSSHSLFPLNDRTNYDSETKQNKKDSNNSYKCSLTSFKGFGSALFMTEYQGNEENYLSQKSNKTDFSSSSNSNKEKIKFSPSLEKCLTSELLDSITNDSSNIKKWKNHLFSNYDKDLKDFSQKEENPQDFLKITKKLFIQDNQEHSPFKEKNKNSNQNSYKGCDDGTNFKDKKKISIYEETINRFEYQLKFIENSVHNILPKSYKKLSENSNKSNYNYYNNKDNQSFSPFAYSNEYKSNDNNCIYSSYKNENINCSNNIASVSEFELYDIEADLNDKSSLTKNQSNNISYNLNNNSKIYQYNHQIHKLKISDSYFGDWICNRCNCANRGYRKACSKCGIYKNFIL